MSSRGGNLSTCARPIYRSPARGPRPYRARQALVSLLIAALLVAQSGCMTTGWGEWFGNGCKVGPDYCKPPAPVADEWIPSTAAKVENRRIVEWWTVFDDPHLNGLVE